MTQPPMQCAVPGTLNRISGTMLMGVPPPARLRRGLQHFVSRRAMDIEGLGEALADQLVGGGMVKDYADIYDLRVDAGGDERKDLVKSTEASCRYLKDLILDFVGLDKWLIAIITLLNLACIPVVPVTFARHTA